LDRLERGGGLKVPLEYKKSILEREALSSAVEVVERRSEMLARKVARAVGEGADGGER
jgi:hypothetical protein